MRLSVWDVFLHEDAEAYKTEVSWLETMAEKSRSMKRVHFGGIVYSCNEEQCFFEVVVGETVRFCIVRLVTSVSKMLRKYGYFEKTLYSHILLFLISGTYLICTA